MKSSGADEAAALRLLGLARRAGTVVPGASATRAALGRGHARLVLTAADASAVQLAKIEKHLGVVPRRTVGGRDVLGRALGAAPVTAAAVTDEGLAEAILRLLDESGSAGRSRVSRQRSDPVSVEDD